MKRQNSFSLTNYLLTAVIFLLTVGLVGLLAKPKDDIPVHSLYSDKAVPLSNGTFNQPGDIQGAASGLQSAAAVTPSKLDQLQIGR